MADIKAPRPPSGVRMDGNDSFNLIEWNFSEDSGWAKTKIYKASSQEGTYTELTEITDSTIKEFKDLAGLSTDFYRLTHIDADANESIPSARVQKGDSLGVLFEAADLQKYEPEIEDFKGSLLTDYFKQIKQTSVEIELELIRRQVIKNSSQLMITKELELSAIFKTLVIIFRFLMREPDDIFSLKKQEYQKLYNEQIRNYLLTIDLDDDGILDEFELNQKQSGVIR